MTVIVEGSPKQIVAESTAVFEHIYDSLAEQSQGLAFKWALEITLALAKKSGFDPERFERGNT